MVAGLLAVAERLSLAAAVVSLGAMALVTFVDVTGRYLFNNPLPDGFDLTRLLLGIAIFWGLVQCCRRDEHIALDLLYDGAGPRRRRWLRRVAGTVTASFFLLLAWKVGERALEDMAVGTRTADLGIPVGPFSLAAASGLAVAALFAVRAAWRAWADRAEAGPESAGS